MMPVLAILIAYLSAPPSADDVERATKEVLADPAYADAVMNVHVTGGLLRSAFAALRKVFEWIRSLLEDFTQLNETRPVLFWSIMACLIGVLCLLVWHISYTLSLAFRRPPEARPEVSAAERMARFGELWAQAKQLAARGEHAEAIRCLLFALLARAEERRLPVLAGWTNREIVRRLRSKAALEGPLLEFVETVDRLWYGRVPAGEEDWLRSANAVGEYLRASGTEAER
jgi:hypothetical protein